MINYLVFDIETRVDKDLVKQIYDPENSLTLDQAYDTARDQILERSNQQSDFFPIPYHIPIAIATLQADEDYRIRTLGCAGADRHSETEMVSRFWQIFESVQTLVSFNGRGFDLHEVNDRSVSADGARLASGNGLLNMQKRLEEVGGACEWNTAPGEGARVKLTIVVER